MVLTVQGNSVIPVQSGNLNLIAEPLNKLRIVAADD